MVKITSAEQKRLDAVNTQKTNAINESNNSYNQLIQNEKTRKDNLDSLAQKYETQQNAILDKQLENQKNVINQQKTDADNRAFEERLRALNSYTDYTNPYGYQNEAIGDAGLTNSGVNQVAQQSAYVTYQNRVGTANKVLQDAITKYDQELNDAILNNDVTKAQNALTKLQTQMNNLDNYYTNVSTLKQNKLQSSQNLNSTYMSQYNQVYNQIMAEKQFDESVRQFNVAQKAKASSKKSSSKKNNTPVAGGGTDDKVSKATKDLNAFKATASAVGATGASATQVYDKIADVAKTYQLTESQIKSLAKNIGLL